MPEPEQQPPIAEDVAEFARRRGLELLRFAYLLCGDRQLAEDLFQDVLLNMYRRYPDGLPLDNPVGYARRALANANVSRARRASSREYVRAVLPERAAPSEPDPAERDALWRALQHLPVRQRTVLVLRFYLDATRPGHRRHPRLPARHGAQPRVAGAGRAATGPHARTPGRRCAVNADLETRLRSTLHEHADDITALPPRLAELRRPDDLAIAPSPARRPRTRWLPAAAVAIVVVIAGLVVGIRQLNQHTPSVVTPTVSPTAPTTAAPTSPGPSPTSTSTVPLACRATLPQEWKDALNATGSAYGAQSAMPMDVAPDGELLVARDFGHGQPRDLALVASNGTPHSVFQVPDPNQLDVQDAYIYSHWLVVSTGNAPRAARGTVPGSSPMPNVVGLYVVDLRTGAQSTITNSNGHTITQAVELDGIVYWDLRARYSSSSGVIRSYDLGPAT